MRRGALLVLVVLVTACSSSNSPKVALDTTTSAGQTTTTTIAPTTTVSSAEDNALAYVKAVTSGSTSDYQAAVDGSAPGSPAHAYATFQAAQATAWARQGRAIPAGTTKVNDDGTISACKSGFTSSD